MKQNIKSYIKIVCTLSAISLITLTLASCGKTASSSQIPSTYQASSVGTSSSITSSSVISSTASPSSTISGVSTSSTPVFHFTGTAPAYTTTDWLTYVANSSVKIMEYKADVPIDWKNEGPSFIVNNKIVASVGGLVYLSKGQTLPDKMKTNKDTGTVLSEDKITIGTQSGKLRVCEVKTTDGKTEYRNEYYINQVDKVFIMIFYTSNKNSAVDKAQYEKILSNITFAESKTQ